MRKLLQKKKAGFTLIELMIVVAILGILAAIAIPAFVGYIRRAKTAEATANVNNMFKASASYYQANHTANASITAATTTNCTVPAQVGPNTPGQNKQVWPSGSTVSSFEAAGFQLADYVYYNYNIVGSGTGACGNTQSNTALYTFTAVGDLDGDSVFSTFSLAVGSDEGNELYHARGFSVTNETE